MPPAAAAEKPNRYAAYAVPCAVFANLKLLEYLNLVLFDAPHLVWGYPVTNATDLLVKLTLATSLPVACGVLAVGFGFLALGRAARGEAVGCSRRAILFAIGLGAFGLLSNGVWLTLAVANYVRT